MMVTEKSLIPELVCRIARAEDVDSIVQIHNDAFPGFFLTSLGDSFLKLYYSCVIKSDDAVSCVATENGRILGFAVTAYHSRGFNRRLIMNNLKLFIPESMRIVLCRPKALIRLVRNFTKKSINEDDKMEYAELFSIGVRKSEQGRGIGTNLLKETESELKIVGIKRLSLTTDLLNNSATMSFYQSMGFDLLYLFEAYPNRKMCRLIKSF